MDLSVGRSIPGEKGFYQIRELLSFGKRSKSYSCLDASGKRLRIKLYDGNSTMKGPVRERYGQLPNMKGVISRVDFGEVDGYPFDVFEVWEGDVSQKIVSQTAIRKQIILPLNEALRTMHGMGILVRDITPWHILFHDYGKTCALSAFSNLTLLNRMATATHKRSFGEDPRFLAPEVDQEGYSVASDYYALGVTLYAIHKGLRALDSIPDAMWQNWKSFGVSPFEMNDRIRGEEYTAFTQSDRLEYLIMGLTLPDPSARWGYGEVRAWCYDQDIPLVQRRNRETYDMAVPLTIKGRHCWNYRQLADILAHNPDAVTDSEIFRRIVRHISQWDAKISEKLQWALQESSIALGRILRWVYILNPSTPGLWWNGMQYHSCEELAVKAELNVSVFGALSTILRDRCISFWLDNTENLVNAATKDMVRALESEECRRETAGANRFIQVFGAEHRFRYHGRTYHSISELLRDYAENKRLTEKEAAEMLANQSFRAWVWSDGYENVLETIEVNAVEKGMNKFDTFLLLCERIGLNSDREMVRRIYLQYGEYAPVFWLQENIDKYSFAGSSERLKMQFLSGFITEFLSIGQMQAELPEQLRIYQEIVRASKDKGDIIPCDSQYAFTKKWNNIETTPMFMDGIRRAL